MRWIEVLLSVVVIFSAVAQVVHACVLARLRRKVSEAEDQIRLTTLLGVDAHRRLDRVETRD